LADATQSFRISRHDLKFKTLRTYVGSLGRFDSWVGKGSVADLTADNANSYIASVIDHRFMARNDGRALKLFSKWLVRAGYISTDPLISVSVPKTPKWRPKPFAPEVVPVILEASGDSRTGARDRAIVALSMATGARPQEIHQLRWPQDVDLVNGLVMIREETSKTESGHRKVPIPPQVIALLHEYIDRYRSPGPGPLWLHFRTRRALKEAGFMAIHHRLRDYLRRQGIQGYQAYRNRHTGITDMVKAGLSTLVTMQLAGHKSPVVTQHYVGKLSDSDLRSLPDWFTKSHGRVLN
jgi:site-specific recombinase XerD